MIQCREHFRLALKAGEPIGVMLPAAGEYLQGDVALQPTVARSVNSPIPPTPSNATTS